MTKYFIFGDKKKLSKEDRLAIEEGRQSRLREHDKYLGEKSKRQFDEEDNLVHPEGRIVVKVDMEFKNFHQFENGLIIRRERKFNEFNRRITQPVNCLVISGEGIPKDAEMLVDHNAFHETYRINDYKNSFELEDSDRVRYYSIPVYECYAWRTDGEWNPIPPFDFGLRVFKPYEGIIQNIEPIVLKDILFVTSGELKGNVVKTLVGCDYQIIFQDTNGKENYLICFRSFGDEKRKMDEEAIAILHNETELVHSGKLLIGYEVKDAKQFIGEPTKNYIPKDFQLEYRNVTVL